jgi:uncharacterized protein (TIGR02452 family)
MDRETSARLSGETLEILERGGYEAADGTSRSIAADLERARAGTVEYPPDAAPNYNGPRDRDTTIVVTRETTLAAAERLARADRDPAALNYASAMNPGGGFLAGSRAQEESLARASGLFPCIDRRSMYAVHRERARDPMYLTWAIYSPRVPVIRDDDGRLLDEPWLCSFVTSPAPNAGVVLRRDPDRAAEVREAMRERIDRVLAVAAVNGHRTYVLGAWGCGVFGNDPVEVAGLFDEALRGPWAGVFDEIVFAIPGKSGDRSRRAFAERFGEAVDP